MEPQAQTLVGPGVEWIDDYNDVAASAWSDFIRVTVYEETELLYTERQSYCI